MANSKLFNGISAECNYLDPDIIRKVYIGLIRYMLKQLGTGKEVVFPDFGNFRITEYKERKIGNVNTGLSEIIQPTKVIKFSASNSLKKYIKGRA